jgi:hypothetical protein
LFRRAPICTFAVFLIKNTSFAKATARQANDERSVFRNKLANSWTAEPPFVQARADR